MSGEIQRRPGAPRPRYRAAVIGCGWIGAGKAGDPSVIGEQSHAGAYVRHARTSLVGVADSDRTRAWKAAELWAPDAAFDEPAAMLETVEPEIVSICTPDSGHGDAIRLALGCPSVKAVLAEKPLALTQEEARELVAMAESRGVVLAVNYSRRYSPAYQGLGRFMAGGGIGAIRHVHGYYGKGLLHNGTHWIDLLRFFFGPPASASRMDDGSAEGGTPSVSFRLSAGFDAVLHAVPDHGFTIFEMDVIGDAGRVRFLDSGNRVEVHLPAPSPYYEGYRNLAPARIRERALKHVIVLAVNDVVACLDGRKKAPLCPGADGVAAVGIAERLLEEGGYGS